MFDRRFLHLLLLRIFIIRHPNIMRWFVYVVVYSVVLSTITTVISVIIRGPPRGGDVTTRN